MMLYYDTKVMVCLPDGDIVTGVLLGDTMAPFLFIICLNHEQETSIDLMKENEITLKKRQYPVEIITGQAT